MKNKQIPELAGLGLRATAVIIDTAILFIIELLILSPLLLSPTYLAYFDQEVGPEGFNILFITIMIPLWLVYFVLQEGLWGQTIGKRITKIKVVKTNGEKAGWLKVLIRNLFRFIDVIGPSPYAVGMISIMVTKNRQRIGDIIAGTKVVKVDELQNP
ncbi:MAG: RDD family protein [Candidatus Methanomethylicota archaeon]|uniref:RDD family protein n=1 Tax=Thermoproteota archaeon TaxID=2056631 RepID=A0A497EJM8_9CREN|nr:MAG: RDD family protein [Candidatus Verstraetearchaeota archaeon]